MLLLKIPGGRWDKMVPTVLLSALLLHLTDAVASEP